MIIGNIKWYTLAIIKSEMVVYFFSPLVSRWNGHILSYCNEYNGKKVFAVFCALSNEETEEELGWSDAEIAREAEAEAKANCLPTEPQALWNNEALHGSLPSYEYMCTVIVHMYSVLSGGWCKLPHVRVRWTRAKPQASRGVRARLSEC